MDHQIKSNQIFGSPNRFLPRSGGELQQQSLHEVRAWQKDNQILDLERHNQILELWFKSGSSLVYQCQKLTLQYPRFLSLPIGYRY